MPATPKLLGGRYQFIQSLNRHQAGQTFLAADVHYPGHPKCVVRQLRLPTRNPMTRKFILSLLKKKVEVLEVIGQHERVPSTFAAFDVERNFYIVQEFIPGRSLEEELVVGQPWTQNDVLQLLREVLPVIAFAQEHGIVHGNLKPSKMIRHRLRNKLVLLDFGAIKTISQNISSKENSEPAAQTPKSAQLYLAPEQFRRQSLFCSDHYALGMVAIQALMGLPPEELPTGQDKRFYQEITTSLESIPNLRTNLAGLLTRMVHPNPKQRYQKATEILSDLEHLDELDPLDPYKAAESMLQPVEEENSIEGRYQASRKIPSRFAGITVVALLAIVAGLLALRLPQRLMVRRHMSEAQVLKLDNPEAAIAKYSEAIEILPRSAQALANRGKLHFEVGDTEAALTDITEAIEQDSNNATYRYERGNFRFAVGDVQGAIEDYTQAISQDTNFVKAYINRGSARANWGDDKGAVEDYTKAIELATDADTEAAAYLNRCLSYSNLDNQMLALDDCTHAINLRPSHGLAYQNRGLVRRRLGDFPGSLKDYNIAIEIEPDAPDPYYNRALTRQALNDISGAMQDFTRAINIDPNYVFAIYDRGRLQADLGDITAALSDFRQASQLCLDLGRTGCYEDAQYQISRLQDTRPDP